MHTISGKIIDLGVLSSVNLDKDAMIVLDFTLCKKVL